MSIPPLPTHLSDWKDPDVIQAALGWLRLAVGAAFAAILLYDFAVGRIDVNGFIKAILSILAIDSGANGILHLMNASKEK